MITAELVDRLARIVGVLEEQAASIEKLIDFALAHEVHIQGLEQRIERLEAAELSEGNDHDRAKQ